MTTDPTSITEAEQPYREYIADVLALIARRLSPVYAHLGGDESFDESFESLCRAVSSVNARTFRAAVNPLLTLHGIGVDVAPGEVPIEQQIEEAVRTVVT